MEAVTPERLRRLKQERQRAIALLRGLEQQIRVHEQARGAADLRLEIADAEDRGAIGAAAALRAGGAAREVR